MLGVILYGPPAAGKDSITRALAEVWPQTRQFLRLKAGSGRTTGYRMTSEGEIDALRRAGEVIFENHRYSATYVVDRPYMRKMLANQEIPVVHLGQLEAIDAVVSALPDVQWTIVYLWCPRDLAATRVAARGTGDVADRLQAWDETDSLENADMTVNTAETEAKQVAEAIRVRALSPGRP